MIYGTKLRLLWIAGGSLFYPDGFDPEGCFIPENRKIMIGENSASPVQTVRLSRYNEAVPNGRIAPERIADGMAFSEDMVILLKCVDRSITEAIVPPGVKYIADRAFFDCSHLMQVVIPDSVIAIGNSAFAQCQALNMVTLPEDITVIGEAAFRDCTRLESVVFDRTGNGMPANARAMARICSFAFSGCLLLGSISVPDDVYEIGCSAFEGCRALSEIALPRGLSRIGEDAFAGCVSLTEFIIPDGVARIEPWTFYNCTALSHVYIPQGVVSIGESAFEACPGLSEIKIPSSVVSIDPQAFGRVDERLAGSVEAARRAAETAEDDFCLDMSLITAGCIAAGVIAGRNIRDDDDDYYDRYGGSDDDCYDCYGGDDDDDNDDGYDCCDIDDCDDCDDCFEERF